jgi:hypothetical protein
MMERYCGWLGERVTALMEQGLRGAELQARVRALFEALSCAGG